MIKVRSGGTMWWNHELWASGNSQVAGLKGVVSMSCLDTVSKVLILVWACLTSAYPTALALSESTASPQSF